MVLDLDLHSSAAKGKNGLDELQNEEVVTKLSYNLLFFEFIYFSIQPSYGYPGVFS